MKKLGFVFLFASAMAGNSFGTSYISNDGNWGTTTSWNPIGIPQPADTANIIGNKIVNLDTNSTISTLFLGKSNGTGTLNVNTAGNTLTVSTNTTIGYLTTIAGTVNVTDGAVVVNGMTTFNTKGVLSITGNAATAVSINDFTNTVFKGTFKFVLGPLGVTPITLNSSESLIACKLIVDISAYTGGLATIPLLSAPSFTGSAPPASITVTNTPAGWSAVVTQDLAAGKVTLRVVPPPELDLIIYTK